MDSIITKNNLAISIIIPVYNVEEYLRRCLDSVFNQKFEYDYEVIVVEDCSTDSSLYILKEYEINHSNLLLINHKTNQKLSIARKTGIAAASGEYIMHVDSDDWILPNTLNNLYRKCKQTNADVLVYNYVKQNDKKRVLISDIKSEKITTDKLSVQKYFYGAPWNKIVKREFTNNMLCGKESINSSEDLLYCVELLLRVNSICLIPEFHYSYFINQNSITKTISSKDFLQNQIKVLSMINNIFQYYKATDLFLGNVLNYFEKWIYLEFLKSHFLGTKIDYMEDVLKDFSKYPIMDYKRIGKLKLSINSKFICLIEVIRYFGFITAIGIVRRGISRSINYK